MVQDLHPEALSGRYEQKERYNLINLAPKLWSEIRGELGMREKRLCTYDIESSRH